MTVEQQIVEQQQPEAPAGPWLSPKQAATRAGRNERTIREALHEFDRTHGKSGLRGSQRAANCTWRIHVEDVDAWVRGEKPRKLSHERPHQRQGRRGRAGRRPRPRRQVTPEMREAGASTPAPAPPDKEIGCHPPPSLPTPAT